MLDLVQQAGVRERSTVGSSDGNELRSGKCSILQELMERFDRGLLIGFGFIWREYHAATPYQFI
jgi:hypothetical protein